MRDSITEAWLWEEERGEEGKLVRVRKDGWVALTEEKHIGPL